MLDTPKVFLEHWLQDDGIVPAVRRWEDLERVHDKNCAYLAWQDKEEE